MQLITETDALARACRNLSQTEYVTVDTEFMRERTYWPRLCLVQLGGPDEVALIDALAPDIDLAPLLDLLADTSVLKVFHAARQDIEIFHILSGRVPEPMFDTQVAAMVCGFGDSVGYETLVAKLAKARIDKSSRFTDWSRRPLTEKQLQYALSDVTHLRVAYEKIVQRLERTERADWLAEEMAILTSPATYAADPDESWRRLKTRGREPRFFALLREVAAWREREAQRRDVPRNRVLRDEALSEIAAHAPKTAAELGHVRGLGKDMAEGRGGRALLEAVARGLAVPDADCPRPPKRRAPSPGTGPLVELLKVLLKMKTEMHDVAPKLIAGVADLEAIAADDRAEVRALKGWRHEIFGADALALKHGELALTARNNRIDLVRVDELARADSD
ncbi:MAG: ribonuclease D [Alphaproteobacteria bacterium]